jgi:hypothetical protein
VVLAYRGAAANPLQAVSSLANNDGGGTFSTTAASFNGVSWSGSANVASLLFMSWQPNSATVTWPSGYTAQAAANDGYSFLAIGGRLVSQSVTSLGGQTATVSATQALIPALQIAVLVGP